MTFKYTYIYFFLYIYVYIFGMSHFLIFAPDVTGGDVKAGMEHTEVVLWTALPLVA